MVWDLSAGRLEGDLKGHTGAVLHARQLPSGDALTFSQDGTLRVWDPETRTCRVLLKGHRSTQGRYLPSQQGTPLVGG